MQSSFPGRGGLTTTVRYARQFQHSPRPETNRYDERTMRFLGAAVLCVVCSSQLVAQSDFYLKDGDTVVFYGDSINDQRLYTTFTEAYVVTRFPKLNVRFVHSGWSGDRVGGGVGGPIGTPLARDV